MGRTRLAIRDENNHRGIAEKLIERAESGDLQAIREIAGRLDGKPAQAGARRMSSGNVWPSMELSAFP